MIETSWKNSEFGVENLLYPTDRYSPCICFHGNNVEALLSEPPSLVILKRTLGQSYVLKRNAETEHEKPSK